jgi:hypothetical protein
VEAVTTLRGDGMSQRAIGSALGISAATVNRTLAGVSDETPADRVTGTDSKSYAATRPERSPFPGPSDAAIKPPVDPGATPAPATESTAAPAAPSREPASAMPPRKPARQPSAEQAAQLPAAILAVLAEADELGLTADQIWARLPMASVHSSWVMPALHELVDAGRVVAAGEGRHGAKWALTPEPITAPPVTPPPGSPATWTDEQRAANQREIDRKRMVAAGRRAARDLVMSVRAEISTVVSAIDLGEKDLINEQVIADLRAAVDLLESRLEASK